MKTLKTGRGVLSFEQQRLDEKKYTVSMSALVGNLKLLAKNLNILGINWGPIRTTLAAIVRKDDEAVTSRFFELFILKEDEERFKENLWFLFDEGFSLARYERRGIYFLQREGVSFKFYVCRKISQSFRYTGDLDFIAEDYLKNSTPTEFHEIALNVPAAVNDYLDFQYGTDADLHRQNASAPKNFFEMLMDLLPDKQYYKLMTLKLRKDFRIFQQLCKKRNRTIPEIVFTDPYPFKYRKVLTVGVYDLIHKGHVELFRRARGLGDYLIVAVQDSDFILKYKPTSTILNSTEDRKYMVKSIRYVDEVITYTDVDKIVQEVDFDVFITGADQCHQGFQRAMLWSENHGREHIVLGRTAGVSSSELKNKIQKKHTP